MYKINEHKYQAKTIINECIEMQTTLENKDMEIEKLKSMFASKSTEVDAKRKYNDEN